MKNFARFLVSALILFTVPATFASNPDSLNDRIEEMELEEDVEEIESFGEAAKAEQDRREGQRLQVEAKDLEKRIQKLERNRKRLKATNDRLAKRYMKSYKHWQKMDAKANKAQARHDRIKGIVDKVQVKVDKVERDAIEANKKRKGLIKDIAQQEKRKQRLERRQKKAQSIVSKHKKTIRKLKANLKKISQRNAKKEKSVVALEYRADAAGEEVARLKGEDGFFDRLFN